MDNEVFDKTTALELVDGDESLLEILLKSFIETEFSVQHFNTLIADKKMTEAASYIHRVKGAGRQLAMKKIAASGQTLEDVVRGKTEGNIKELTDIFYTNYIECLDIISTELSD